MTAPRVYFLRPLQHYCKIPHLGVINRSLVGLAPTRVTVLQPTVLESPAFHCRMLAQLRAVALGDSHSQLSSAQSLRGVSVGQVCAQVPALSV